MEWKWVVRFRRVRGGELCVFVAEDCSTAAQAIAQLNLPDAVDVSADFEMVS